MEENKKQGFKSVSVHQTPPASGSVLLCAVQRLANVEAELAELQEEDVVEKSSLKDYNRLMT